MTTTALQADFPFSFGDQFAPKRYSYCDGVWYALHDSFKYYRSTDGMKSWTEHSWPTDLASAIDPEPTFGSRVSVKFSEVCKIGTTLVVICCPLAYWGVYEVHSLTSTDGGLTWTFHDTVIPENNGDFAYMYTDGTTLVAYENQSSTKAWLSTDGVTFTAGTDFGSTLFTGYNLVKAGSAWLGIRSNNIVRSTDDGDSWTALSDSINQMLSIASNGSRVLTFGSDGFIWYSDDDGVTWTSVDFSSTFTGGASGYAWWDGTQFLIAISTDVYASTDGISSWSPMGIGSLLTGSYIESYGVSDGAGLSAVPDSGVDFMVELRPYTYQLRDPLRINAGLRKTFAPGDLLPIASGGTGVPNSFQFRKQFKLDYDVDVAKYRRWFPSFDTNFASGLDPDTGSFVWGQSFVSGWTPGYVAFAVGGGALATGDQSVAWGSANSSLNGQHSTTPFNLGFGQVSQATRIHLGGFTFDTTPQELFTNTFSQRLILPNNTVMDYDARVVGFNPANGDTKSWRVTGMAAKGSTASSIVEDHDIVVKSSTSGASAWTLAIGVDTTDGAVTFTFGTDYEGEGRCYAIVDAAWLQGDAAPSSVALT